MPWLRLELLAQRYAPRLLSVYQGRQAAWSPWTALYRDCQQGAWKLLPRLPTEAQLLDAWRHIPVEDLSPERLRFAEHRERLRLPSRSLRQTQAQFHQR